MLTSLIFYLLVTHYTIITRPGKRLQFANWKITISSSLAWLNGDDFYGPCSSIFNSYNKLPEGIYECIARINIPRTRQSI